MLLEQGPSALHSYPACAGILFCNAVQYEEQYAHRIDDAHYVSFFFLELCLENHLFSSLILVFHYRFDPVPVVVNKCTAKRCKVIFVVLAVALRTLFLVTGII